MSEENKGPNITPSSESQSLWSDQENSYGYFFQGEEWRPPIEIKNPGKYVLSVTENGESVVFYDPNFFENDEAYQLKDRLFTSTNWQTKNITIRGIEYPQPRLVAWYGPFPYSYSGSTLEPAEMPDYILGIKKKVEQYLRKNGINVTLNSVLLNLYRNNRDSVSWHSDDESSMGIFPTIASVSLGETRKFEMRRKLKFEEDSSYTEWDEYFVSLNNGSLLIMDGSMQKDWQHRVPKESRDKCERINLTFRTVYKTESSLPSPDTQIRNLVQSVTKKTCSNKFNYDEKTLNCDTDSACSSIINRGENLSSCLKTVKETNESEEKSHVGLSLNNTLETDDKINEKVKRDIETCSCNEIIIKNEFDGQEEQDELSHNKKSTVLNNLNDDKKNVKNVEMQNKDIDPDSSCSSISTILVDGNAGKSTYSSTTDSQSVSINSALENIKQNACKIKIEPISSTDNAMTSNVEAEDFLPVNTFTTSSKNTFGSCKLENLLNYDVDAMDSKLLLDYAVALKNRVLERIHEFIFSEKAELEVLCKLTDGTQTEENQKLITTRMYFLTNKAVKLQEDIPNVQRSVRNMRQPYRRNRNPYSQRLNQANSRGSHCKW